MEVVSSSNGDMHDDQVDDNGSVTGKIILSTRLEGPNHEYSTPKPDRNSVKIPGFAINVPDQDYGQDTTVKGHARMIPL